MHTAVNQLRRTITMPMSASARSTHGSPHHTIDVNGRHTITTDTPLRLGGTDSAPAPHELLPAMLASCVSTMIGMYAQARDWQLSDVSVDVEYDPQATPRQIQTTVNLPEGLTPDQVARLRRVVDTCPVKRALETGFMFDQQVVQRQPSGATAV
jgi:putative redox protein